MSVAGWRTLGCVLLLAPGVVAAAPLGGPEEALEPDRWEYGVLPAAAATSDFGVGVGLVGHLTRFRASHDPYLWRAAGLVFVAGEPDPAGGVEPTMQFYMARLDFPQALVEDLRLSLIAYYTRDTTTGYYGLGNAAGEDQSYQSIDRDADRDAYVEARRRHFYDYRGPTLQLMTRLRLRGPAWSWLKAEVRQRRSDPYPGSRLQEDLQTANADTPEGRTLGALLLGTEPHWLGLVQLGLMWDTRNHEFDPTAGWYHEVSGRAGWHPTGAYVAVNVTLRGYWALWRDYAVLAGRVNLDSIHGDAPLYRLSTFHGFDSLAGPGGVFAIRGVPEGRYHGKLKVLGDVELRSALWGFRLGDQRFVLGGVVFVDFGRVWADPGRAGSLDRAPETEDALYRTGAVKYGVGGGARLRWGETFVIRADLAYSPDGTGVIVAVDHHF